MKFLLTILCVFSILGNADAFFEVRQVISDIGITRPLYRDTSVIQSMLSDITPGNKYLFKNENGLVYSLKPDNMLCLVPGQIQTMPMQKDHVLPFIPNGILSPKKNR
ncbi:MAG: hypothetical protein JSS67_10155 [Bacteroidetes bacterium]|nr:hypothetical protein [Bacteroidota bacterium]